MSKPVEIFRAYHEYLQPARFKVAYGGRGSAKTRTFCSILLNNVMCHGWRLVCFREVMKSIDDSVYQEFIDEIDRRELNQFFNTTKSPAVISCPVSGGVIKFDGLFRNTQKIKGYAGFDAAWVEEAANVSKDSWKFLIPTLRKPGSEIWVSYNPESPLDDTHKRFVTARVYPDYKDGKRYCIVKKINYDQNPRFPDELRDDMEVMKESDPDLYQHVYLGEPAANSDLSVVPPAWVAAAVDIHKYLDIAPSGGKVVGFDVADEGADANAMALIHGWVVTGLYEWKDKDPNSAAVEVFDRCCEAGAEEIIFDAIGVGAGAKGELRQRVDDWTNAAKMPPVITPFMASDAVVDPDCEYSGGRTNKEVFTNLKAQAYWNIRDRCYNAWKARNGKPYDESKLISFDSETIPEKHLEKIKAELSQPRREYLNGKIRIEPKDRMKKRGVDSPNIAEAVIMAMTPRRNNSIIDLIL